MSHVISCPQCKRQIPLDPKAAKVVLGGTQSVQCASCKHTWMPKSDEVRTLDAAKPVPEVPAPKWKYIPQPQPAPEPEHQESKNQTPEKVATKRNWFKGGVLDEPYWDDVTGATWMLSVNPRIRKESPGLHNLIRLLDGSAFAVFIVGSLALAIEGTGNRRSGPNFGEFYRDFVYVVATSVALLGFATLLRLLALIEINTRTRNTTEQDSESKNDV